MIPPNWGTPLTEADYQNLAASWITPEIADKSMLRRVSGQEGREVVGERGRRDCAGILFPNYWPGEERPRSYRVRRDHPDFVVGQGGKPKSERKYLGAPGGGNQLYLSPGITVEQLQDCSIPIAVFEGEKKAIAAWRLANYQTENPRFIPVAIPGVWNWRGVVAKAKGARGERISVKGPIPDLDRIPFTARRTYIVFDSNVGSNESVKWARTGLARALATRGAEVDFINLPEDCGLNGVDDLLAAWGPDRVLSLFDKPVPGLRKELVVPPQFQSTPEGLFRTSVKDGRVSQIQLTNYCAKIGAAVILDDGVETKQELEIEAELMGRLSQFTIPASQFTAMDWPIQQMGAGAITYPNQKDYARTAIQSYSLTAAERRIFTHTGWRNVTGQWVYLHAAGAIGEAGKVAGVNVRLTGSLSRYELRLPVDQAALVRAVRASLRLIERGPQSVIFPLLAATVRAVFGGADFSVHLVGETGAFKSELAALVQQHFGPGMNRLNLPGTWSSTGNALEMSAFYAKDAVFVIDDFAPQGGASDVSRYHGDADRVFRAVGNHAGRGRLDSNANLRDEKPPRALILSTGEDIPRGHSIRARLLILEIGKGTISGASLAECQSDAADGLYAEAMGAFIRWLAGHYEKLREALRLRACELRLQASADVPHARTPDILGNLHAGFEIFLKFAEASEAIDSSKHMELSVRCWQALLEVARAQTKHQAATEPVARFVTLLQAALASGKAHLASVTGSAPEQSPQSCGWRRDEYGKLWPQGERIGWVDDDHIYLEQTAAFKVAQVMGRDIGDGLPVSEQTLKKRLREKGLLASTDEKRETNTIRRVCEGSEKNVLDFYRRSLLPEESDRPDPDTANSSTSENEIRGATVWFCRRDSSQSDSEPDIKIPNSINNLNEKCRKSQVFIQNNSTSENVCDAVQSTPHKFSTDPVPGREGTGENPTAKPDSRGTGGERFRI